jgi:serine/threonine protein kinase
LSEGFPAEADDLQVSFAPVSRLADYHLEERIGAGGMAVVFRARDERLQRRVALKVLAPALAADEAFRHRFIRESQAAAAVDDPHIIPVFEAGEAEGVLFLAMRYVPGGDVRTLLRRAGPLSPARALAIISPMASALDAAHGAGLVHRDVKLANMLVDVRPGRPDHVYLSDFGLSKMVMSSLGPTMAGQFLGTPGYSAPEQLAGKPVDGRADQYSLACAAFELLCGQTPFPRDQVAAVIWAHLSEPPPTLTERRPGLPPAADAVLARALAKAPRDRYASCRAFADALREALSLAPYNSGSQVSPKADDSGAEIAESVGSGTAKGNISAPAAIADSADDRGTQEAAKPGTPPQTTVSWLGKQDEARDAGASHSPQPATSTPAASRSSPDSAPNGGPLLDSGGGHRARPRRGRGLRWWPIVTTSLLVLVAVIIGGGYIFWRMSQSQYYVKADSSGQVVIYRGINDHILGFSWSSPYQRTGIQLDQVPQNYQQTVTTAGSTGSHSQVTQTVTNIRAAVDACRIAYLNQQNWVTRDNEYNAYRARVAAANKAKQHPTSGAATNPGPAVANPGPPPLGAGQRPTGTGGLCPPAAAFNVPASALTPAAPGSS